MKRIGVGVVLLLALVGMAVLTARHQPTPAAAQSDLAQQGSDLYSQHCASCHQAGGRGVAGTFPPLAGNPALAERDFVIAVLLHGLDALPIVVNGTEYQGMMPGFGDQLADEEMAAVLTYVRASWGNDFGGVEPGEVQQMRASGQMPTELLPAANRPGGGDQEEAETTADDQGNTQAQASGDLAGQLLGYDEIQDLLGDIHFDYRFPGEMIQSGGPFTAAVQLGYLIFVDTQTYASEYVNNDLNCRNCHLSAGSLPYSAPLWAAYPNYPQYRTKNHKINSMQARFQGCFMYSMNGTAPPEGSPETVALLAYTYWLAQGVPTGVTLPGRGFGTYEEETQIPSDLEPDVQAGETIYMDQCAICHGVNGEGTRSVDDERLHLPPLWGTGSFGYWFGTETGPEGPYATQNAPVSFNWGAGLHTVSNFAAFVRWNMPLGQAGSLNNQEAVDVAGWALQDVHQRPIRWVP